MARTGRPTKLTPAVQKQVVDALESGCYLETAASLGGITRKTLYDWLRRGARGEIALEQGNHLDSAEVRFVRFVRACREAMARFEHEALQRIRHHGEKEWTADAWRLERRFPEKYGRQERVSHHHGGGLRVVVAAIPGLNAESTDGQEMVVGAPAPAEITPDDSDVRGLLPPGAQHLAD